MACKNVCSLCPKLIISTAVTFTAGTGLIITIPNGSYNNNCKYCIVISQAIPAETTISAPVLIRIGTGTELYPLVSKSCRQITACGVRARTKYSVCVETTATGATFKMLGNPACQPNNNLAAVDGTAPTVTPAPTPGA